MPLAGTLESTLVRATCRPPSGHDHTAPGLPADEERAGSVCGGVRRAGAVADRRSGRHQRPDVRPAGVQDQRGPGTCSEVLGARTTKVRWEMCVCNRTGECDKLWFQLCQMGMIYNNAIFENYF